MFYKFMSVLYLGWAFIKTMSSIGTTRTASVVEWYDPLIILGVFLLCWFLGYLSAQED